MSSTINRLRGSLRIMVILLNSSVFNRINALRDFVVNLPIIYAVGQIHVSVVPGAGRGRGRIVFLAIPARGWGRGSPKPGDLSGTPHLLEKIWIGKKQCKRQAGFFRGDVLAFMLALIIIVGQGSAYAFGSFPCDEVRKSAVVFGPENVHVIDSPKDHFSDDIGPVLDQNIPQLVRRSAFWRKYILIRNWRIHSEQLVFDDIANAFAFSEQIVESGVLAYSPFNFSRVTGCSSEIKYSNSPRTFIHLCARPDRMFLHAPFRNTIQRTDNNISSFSTFSVLIGAAQLVKSDQPQNISKKYNGEIGSPNFFSWLAYPRWQIVLVYGCGLLLIFFGAAFEMKLNRWSGICVFVGVVISVSAPFIVLAFSLAKEWLGD